MMLQKIERSLVTIGEIVCLNNQLRELAEQIDATCSELQRLTNEMKVVSQKLCIASKVYMKVTKEVEVHHRAMLQKQQDHFNRCIEKHMKMCSDKQNLVLQYLEAHAKFQLLKSSMSDFKVLDISSIEELMEAIQLWHEEVWKGQLMWKNISAKEETVFREKAAAWGISVYDGGAEGSSDKIKEIVSAHKQLAALGKQLDSTSEPCLAALQEHAVSCGKLAGTVDLFVSGRDELEKFRKECKDLKEEFDHLRDNFKGTNNRISPLRKQMDQSSHKLNELKHSLTDCEILGVESKEALEVVVNLRKEKIWEGQICVMNASQSEELLIITAMAHGIPINNDYTAGKGCKRNLDQLGPPAPD